MWNTLIQICCGLIFTVYAPSDAITGYYTEDDCKHLPNAIWNNATATCDCLPDHVISGDLTKCLPEVAAGYDTKCEEDVQCSTRMGPGASCVDQQCVCKKGYHFLFGVCHRSVGYNQECTGRDGECYDSYSFESLTCQDGVCRCAKDYYERGRGECWWKATEEGEDCLNDMDCAFDEGFCNKTSTEQWVCNRPPRNSSESSGLESSGRLGNECSPQDDSCGEHEICILGECICELGYFAFNGTCLPEIGTPCDNANCTHIDKAKCRAGKCSCIAPYVAGEDNRYCRIGRRLGKQCQQDVQCRLSGGMAECVNNKCSCRIGSHYVEEEELCWPSKGLNEACIDDRDCNVDAGIAVCEVNKTCVCQGDLVPSGNNCIPRVQALGDMCIQSEDCTQVIGNSTCQENKCQCDVGFLEDPSSNDTCLVGLGGPCNEMEDCSAIAWSVCVAHKCECRDTFLSNKANDKCLKEAYYIGGPCLEDQQCYLMGENAICGGPEEGCICVDGFYFRVGLCREKRLLGEDCTDSTQCFLESGAVNNVYCMNGVCQCRYDAVQTPDGRDCRNSGLRSGTSQGAVIAILVVGRLLAAAW